MNISDLHETARPEATGRSFYSARVSEFLAADPDAIVGRLSSRHVAFHAAAEQEQVRAWEREIEILHEVFKRLGAPVERWTLLIEAPLLRLGKRLDAVLLAPGVVCVIEFKIGARSYAAEDRVQTERYAQSLKDFHAVSQSRLVVPILYAEHAPTVQAAEGIVDGVASLVLTNAAGLADALRAMLTLVDQDADPLDAYGFDFSSYRPTPTIVEAAQALYAGHQIDEIGRGDAADAELQASAATLQAVAASAERDRKRVICFVTGAPGAGKTLLGLDLALKSRSGERPAAMLSGNRPLVHVLVEALAADVASRGAMTKAKAHYQAASAIQNLLGYLKEHTDGPPPPEHVVVFDEAQRAWDADVGNKLMGRPRSEPALFLDIMERLHWCCLVCLVGPGQEINRGEGGLPLWGEAIASAGGWEVVAAPQALDGGPDVSGPGLLTADLGGEVSVVREPSLHLANAIRAYRNPLHAKWVAALLEGNLGLCRRLANEMSEPPARLTRDLETARAWLRERRRGGRTVGLLASSGAVRLVADGVPPAPRSNELAAIGHWFLKSYEDFRSAGALETPMSEFGCQGLELDYAALCWAGDLIWEDGRWTPRRMQSPRWRVVREEQHRRFRFNGYRVLLTRARAGLVILVPRGSDDDPTRPPGEADRTAEALSQAGCTLI